MSNFRPIPTKCWESFLQHRGFICKRTKGSHDQWVKKGHRTIPVWGNEKQIPALHLKTSCSTLGITLNELFEWIEENC